MTQQYNYYIVAPSEWEDNNLKFRRHRLVEKLLELSSTNEIYWIYPFSCHNRQQIKKYKDEKSKKVMIGTNHILSVGIPDFKGILKNNNLFNRLDFKQKKQILEDKGCTKNIKHILWYTTPIFSNLLDYEWDRINYDCSDLWRDPYHNNKGIYKLIDKLRNTATIKAENLIIEKSDRITTTSPYLAKLIKKQTNKDVCIIENGVDFELFKKAKISSRINDLFEGIPSPRIGFVGGLKGKIDFNVIYQMAVLNEDYSIILVGPIPSNLTSELNRLLDLDNVYYFGAQKNHLIPQFIKQLDLGLLPYKEIEYNKAVSPLKLYEYLACGVTAIGMGIPTTKHHQYAGCYYYSEKDEFINLCVNILENNYMEKEKCISLAKQQDWDVKLKHLIEYSTVS
ncbi:hypothetical protein MKY91_17480 [Alkalicoccobacillus gibsonii]|uniref:Glycosyltransferase family 1 protein n=1 Tax=Alkalicoccobacillus gibsonii TaxID=79881 RepID=A0ABU9VPY5_9BACI